MLLTGRNIETKYIGGIGAKQEYLKKPQEGVVLTSSLGIEGLTN